MKRFEALIGCWWVRGSLCGGVYSFYQYYLLDFVLSFVIGVLVFIIIMVLVLKLVGCGFKKLFLSNRVYEFSCSVLFVLVLVVLVLRSYGLLCYEGCLCKGVIIESEGCGVRENSLEVNIDGHQWYWSYRYGGFRNDMSFDSYILGVIDMDFCGFRLLEVDNRFVLPVNCERVVNITSVDVIHSWFLSGLGFKMDALPGLYNVCCLKFNRVGVFYGMCAEICGVGHRFIPVVVEVVPEVVFLYWLSFSIN